jgi:hypothetical protein
VMVRAQWNPASNLVGRAFGEHVAESLVPRTTAMIRGDRSFKLGTAGDESSRTTAGGGKCCAVERAVRGACFICRGGARR